MLNVFQPDLGQQELDAVGEVFATNWVGRGPQVSSFEEEFAGHLDVAPEHLISINNCTEGLFLSMELLDVGPGDEVVLPSISFVGLGNAIIARGAKPVFCDVDPETLNPAAADIAAVLTDKTRVVAVLHYAGAPGDIREIAALCRDREIYLVEDAAIAVASSVDGQACGTFGDIGLWSFDAGKVVVTVDGGMMYVRDPDLAKRARRRAYLGMGQVSGFDQAAQGAGSWWAFDATEPGRRSISNDVLATIGRVQLERLPEFLSGRQRVVDTYNEALSSVPGVAIAPPLPQGHVSTNYMYYVQFASESVRAHVAKELYERDIYTTFRYYPLHRISLYGHDGSQLPGTEYAVDRTLMLPIHHRISEGEAQKVVRAIQDALASAQEITPTTAGHSTAVVGSSCRYLNTCTVK